jgi:signal transduction histidine kinase
MDLLRRAWLPVGCALVQLLSVSTGAGPPPPGLPRLVFTLVGVAAGLVLFRRQRDPFAVLAATTVGYVVQVTVGGPALPAAVSVAAYTVGRHGAGVDDRGPARFPWTATALLVSVAAVAGSLVGTGERDEAAPYALLTVLAGLAGVLRAFRVTREVQRRHDLLAAERLRIARDLHDVVGHGLGAITVQAGAARFALGAGAADDAVRSLQAIEDAGRGVLREVRWLVGLLREDGDHPTTADVVDLVRNARRSGLDVALRVDGDLAGVCDASGEAAYRIVQEALTNVLRHSGGSAAEVSLSVANTLDLQVLDRAPAGNLVGAGERRDGPGVVEGNGLHGMRERAGAAGGTLEAGPTADGRGWSVRASLPLTGRSR